MNRNRLVTVGLVAVGVSIVALAGISFSVLDTPTTTESDLNATTPDPTVSTAPSQFTMTVDVRSHPLEDGSEQANWSAGVMYDADSRGRLGWLHSTGLDRTTSITRYQHYSDDRTHNFIKYHTSDTEQFSYRVRSIREDLDRETEALRTDNTSRTYTYYRESARSEFEIIPDQIPPLGFIHAIPFAYDGSTTFNGDAVEKYVPTNGWTETTGSVADDGPDTYISNTSGVLYMNEESGNIVHADVSVTSKRTDVRAGRWFDDSGSQGHITLSVREEVDDDELKPEWVREAPFDEKRSHSPQQPGVSPLRNGVHPSAYECLAKAEGVREQFTPLGAATRRSARAGNEYIRARDVEVQIRR